MQHRTCPIPVKLIVAGSRHLEISVEKMENIVTYYSFYRVVEELIHGDCRGVDKSADAWGKTQKHLRHNKIKRFPVTKADYEKHRNKAFWLRNQAMAEYGDFLIAILKAGAENKGTKNMIKCMVDLGKTTVILTRK